jgi:hypothetical protein
MENLKVSRLDYLGIVSGIIDDLGLVQAIDARLQKDKNGQAEISPGEAKKGMVLNGLGFVIKTTVVDALIFPKQTLRAPISRGSQDR